MLTIGRFSLMTEPSSEAQSFKIQYDFTLRLV